MKGKIIVYVLASAAALWLLSRLPNPAVDVGRLEPVEVVELTGTDAGIQLRTDTGAWGAGETLPEAVEMLRRAADREVFLETADKLLLRGDLDGHWPDIYALFRPGCQLCRVTEETDLEAAAEYLRTHRTERTLNDYRARGGTPQILILTEGRGILVPEQ